MSRDDVKCPTCKAIIEACDLDDHLGWHTTLTNLPMEVQKSRQQVKGQVPGSGPVPTSPPPPQAAVTTCVLCNHTANWHRGGKNCVFLLPEGAGWCVCDTFVSVLDSVPT